MLITALRSGKIKFYGGNYGLYRHIDCSKGKGGNTMSKRTRYYIGIMAAILLIVAFVTGCKKLSESKNTTFPEADAQDESDGFGVYVELKRDDVSCVVLQVGIFAKVCENADGSPLKAGEWLFTGNDIDRLSKEENSSVPFTVIARDAGDKLLSEGTFLYDVTQEKLYVTISADGVTCAACDSQ